MSKVPGFNECGARNVLPVGTRELLAPDAGALLGRSRGRVLELLRDAQAPLTAAGVARHCGLHPSTARFHLDALVESGLATRDPGNAHAAPGRPPIGYRAAQVGTAGAASGQRRYRLLAEMLASLVAGLVDDPAVTAERAGREWGGYLTDPPAPYHRPSVADAMAELTELLASMGFDPEVQPGDTALARGVVLHECPFREVALEHKTVVCSLHLGVIRGALDRMRAPLDASRVDVFAEHGTCRVYLRTPMADLRLLFVVTFGLGKPGRQLANRYFELGIEPGKRLQSEREPAQAHLLVPALLR
jgi:predicted ArsR family transcriptional regulator